MFKPLNRYILVEPQPDEQRETNSGIVLPDNFKPTEERYTVVSVIAWADDVRFKNKLAAASGKQELPKLIIDKSMLEEIIVDETKYNVILDNYIIGILHWHKDIRWDG